MSTPTPPPDQKSSTLGKKIRIALGIIMLLVFALIYLGQKTMMGKRYQVSDKEAVNYSEQATEEDAKKVGEALKADGYFTGKNAVDVLLKKNDKEGVVVSFVGNWNWTDETVVSSFKQVGEDIAKNGLGKPLTVRLLDTKLNTKNEIKLP